MAETSQTITWKDIFLTKMFEWNIWYNYHCFVVSNSCTESSCSLKRKCCHLDEIFLASLYWNLSFSVQPVTKISPKWWHATFLSSKNALLGYFLILYNAWHRLRKLTLFFWSFFGCEMFWISFRLPSDIFNSLGPSDAIWRQKTGSTLAQVMACCLTAPSHYLTQCWLIISKVYSDILLRAISQQVSQPSTTVISLKSTQLKFH